MTRPLCPECETKMARMYSSDPETGTGFKSLGERYWCWNCEKGFRISWTEIILPPIQSPLPSNQKVTR